MGLGWPVAITLCTALVIGAILKCRTQGAAERFIPLAPIGPGFRLPQMTAEDERAIINAMRLPPELLHPPRPNRDHAQAMR